MGLYSQLGHRSCIPMLHPASSMSGWYRQDLIWQVHKVTGTQGHRYARSQICKVTDTQGPQTHKIMDTQHHRHTRLWIHRATDAQGHRRTRPWIQLYPEFLVNCGNTAIQWLSQLLTTCLETQRIPKIWKYANVITLLKANKPAGEAKSYRPISLLSICFKLFERIILNRINNIVEEVLPQEQAGFRKGQCANDQVTLLTDNIETAFEERKKAGVVMVDLSAAHNTVWHQGLKLKLLQTLKDQEMVNMIMEMVTNRSFILSTTDGITSRRRCLKNRVSQESVLVPVLFNIYMHD